MPLIFGIAFCLVLVWIFRGERGRYRYNWKNQAQRHCLDCGQEQNAYAASASTDWWWEPVGVKINPTCKCHKDAR